MSTTAMQRKLARRESSPPIDYDDDSYWSAQEQFEGAGVILWGVAVVTMVLMAFALWRLFG